MATKDNWKESLVLSVKEFGKVALLAMIPLLISGLAQRQVDIYAVGIAGAIALLNAVNEFLKKSNKIDTENLNKVSAGLLG